LDDYIKVASFKLDVSQNILKNQILNKQANEYSIGDNNAINLDIIRSKSNKNQSFLMEENLIKLAFSATNRERIEYFKSKISSYQAQDSDNALLLDVIDKKILEVNNVDELAKKLFFEFCNEQQIQKKISDNIFSSQEFNNLSDEDYKKAVDETFLRLERFRIQDKKEELKKKLKDENLTAEEKLKISTQIFQNLKQN
jgi:hypothetical protein